MLAARIFLSKTEESSLSSSSSSPSRPMFCPGNTPPLRNDTTWAGTTKTLHEQLSNYSWERKRRERGRNGHLLLVVGTQFLGFLQQFQPLNLPGQHGKCGLEPLLQAHCVQNLHTAPHRNKRLAIHLVWIVHFHKSWFYISNKIPIYLAIVLKLLFH